MDDFLVHIIAETVRDSPCIHSWIPVAPMYRILTDSMTDATYVCRYCEFQINKQVFDEIGKERQS